MDLKGIRIHHIKKMSVGVNESRAIVFTLAVFFYEY